MDLRKILTPHGCSVSAGDGLAVQSGNKKLLTLSLDEIQGHKWLRCSPCIMVVWVTNILVKCRFCTLQHL